MTCSRATSPLLAGALSGLAGTATMMAMRMFDESYAPKTIPKTRRDPGKYMVRKTEAATNLPKILPHGSVRRQIENTGAITMQVGYGVLPGIAYAMMRGHRRNGSSLVEGAAIGVGVYLIGYFGWLPLLGLTRPTWKQSLPEVVGETMRHVAYGVTTAAVYGALESVGSESL